MDIFRLSAFCVAACILIKLLGTAGAEFKTAAAIFAAAVVAGHFLSGFAGLAGAARELFGQTGLDEEYLTIVFKSVGICYITQIACDCCRDSGENALASQLELAGKAALLLTALPMFEAAAETIRDLLTL
jgi:stage III sporulation protein AD